MNKCSSFRSIVLCKVHRSWSFIRLNVSFSSIICPFYLLRILSSSRQKTCYTEQPVQGNAQVLSWSFHPLECISSAINHALSCNSNGCGNIMWPEMVGSVFHGLRLPNPVMLSKATYLFISHMLPSDS